MAVAYFGGGLIRLFGVSLTTNKETGERKMRQTFGRILGKTIVMSGGKEGGKCWVNRYFQLEVPQKLKK